MSSICDTLPTGFAYFTITVPPPQSGYDDSILKICVGTLLELNFKTIEEPEGLPDGATSLETAIALEDALNNRLTTTLVTARDDYDMIVTRYNNILTIALQADPIHCGERVTMFNYSLAADSNPCGTPFFEFRAPYVLACSPLTCCPPPDSPTCSDYPSDSYVQRIQFTNVSQVFGPGSGSLRKRGYVCGTGRQVNPVGWNPGLAFNFDGVGYTDFDSWVAGWADYWNTPTNDWFHSVTDLGGGLVELVANTSSVYVQNSGWIDNGIPIEVVGVGSFDPQNYAPLTMTVLSQTDCSGDDTVIVVDPPTPDEPPLPPDFTPPEVPPTPEYIAPICREFFDFECCLYSAGGVRRTLIIDKNYFTGYNLDEDGRVTGVTTSVPVWYELCLKDGVTILDVSEERGDAGVRFAVSLAAATYLMSQQNRNVLETLRRRRLVLIIEDANERYWLMGEDGGARVENLAGTTGARGADGNSYAFVFRAFARVLPRVVSIDMIEALQIGVIDCEAFVGIPIGDEYLATIGNCYIYDLGDDYFEE